MVIFCNKGIGVGVQREMLRQEGSLCAGKGYLKRSGTNDGMSIVREYTHTSTKMRGARGFKWDL